MILKRMRESRRIKAWYLTVLIPMLGSVHESLLRRSHGGTRVIALAWEEVICFSCIMLNEVLLKSTSSASCSCLGWDIRNRSIRLTLQNSLTNC